MKPTRDRAAYMVIYYAAHRAERASYQAAYNAAHHEEAVARTHARREERAAHYAAHREQYAAYQAAYNAAHREEGNARTHARRARLRGLPSERVLISVLFERDKGACGICGKRVYKNARDRMLRPGHDHILPVSLGGANTYINSRLVHRRCNIERGNRGAAQLRMTA